MTCSWTWIYDLPRFGPYLRERKYRSAFESLKLGDIAIDCGANVGKFTKRMARPGVTVYAFEPDPAAFAALERNTAGLPGVVCINKAVSDHAGEARIYFGLRYAENPLKWSTGTTLVKEKSNVDRNNFATCELIDLADFIKKLEKPPMLIKMDIEGEEVAVLNRLLDEGLLRKVGHVLVETHERIPELAEPTTALRKRIAKERLKNVDLNWA